MSDNRRQFLSEIMSIDAWHDPIVYNSNSAGVYVDMTFEEGRIGGDRGEIPFTFKLNLKRALVTVEVGKSLKFDRRRVARTVPESNVEHTRLRGAREIAESEISSSGSVDLAALAVAISGGAKKRDEISREDEIRLVQTLPETLVTPKSGGISGYSWILEPTFRDFLRGQPWDPFEEPRLFVDNIDKDLNEHHISVGVHCAFEDLDISDIQPKASMASRDQEELLFHDVNKKSAEHFLKLLLTEAHLLPGRLDNRFRNVVIASVIALEN